MQNRNYVENRKDVALLGESGAILWGISGPVRISYGDRRGFGRDRLANFGRKGHAWIELEEAVKNLAK